MRPILCIIDLTDSSATVVNTAVRIASAFKTHLIVLYPYRLIDYTYMGNLPSLNSKLVDHANAKFNALKQQGENITHLTYEFRSEIGFSSDRITAFLNAGEAEMIVIGQHQANEMDEHNKTGLQDLIKNSKLPFTIVPEILSARERLALI